MTGSSDAAPAVIVEGLELITYVKLRITTPRWWTDAAMVRTVVDALAATAQWRDLDVLGVAYKPGAPLGSLDEVAAKLSTGGGLYNFARGGPRHAIFANETDAWLQVGIAETSLKLISQLCGEVLPRLGPAALDDLVAAVSQIRSALDGRIHLLEMHARPTAKGALSYPRPTPRRRAAVPVSAVLDVVDLEPASDPGDEAVARAERALAHATVPSGVSRQVMGKLVVLRWVDDPSSPVDVCAAAARHEAWVTEFVETTVEDSTATGS